MAGIDEQNEDWTAVDYLLFFSEDERRAGENPDRAPGQDGRRPPSDRLPQQDSPASHATKRTQPPRAEPASEPAPQPVPAEGPAPTGFLSRLLAALRGLFARR